MTIAEMINNGLTQNIFPTTYDFYLDDSQARKTFEDKFIKHYYYREIGFDSPFMFIQKLESHLLLNMPYWKQLYQTELESRNINFLLNKDLLETFIREIDTENETTGTNSTQQTSTNVSSLNQEGTSTTEQTDSQQSNAKESLIRDGVAQASLTDGYLTGTNSNTTTNTQNVSGTSGTTGTSNSSDKLTSEGTLSHSENGKTVEKTELLSQGNIGITSSAQLLKEWRDVLINMDKIIIESCNDLFMKIY